MRLPWNVQRLQNASFLRSVRALLCTTLRNLFVDTVQRNGAASVSCSVANLPSLQLRMRNWPFSTRE